MGLTQSAYARHRKAEGLRGATRQAVSLAVKEGRIRLLPDGTIDADEADAMWEANSQTPADTAQTAAARPRNKRPDAEISYNDERARKERADADLRELKLAELRGELVRRDAVELAWAEVATQTRERVLAVPDRVTPRITDGLLEQLADRLDEEGKALVKEYARHHVRQAVLEEVTEALHAVSDELVDSRT